MEPCSEDIFRNMVANARSRFSVNKDSGSDELYIGSDGLRGSSWFYLDRSRRILTVRHFVETAARPFTEVYYLHFTPDGWVRADVKLTGEQLSEVSKSNHRREYWDGVGG
jgi:hypothetical protein